MHRSLFVIPVAIVMVAAPLAAQREQASPERERETAPAGFHVGAMVGGATLERASDRWDRPRSDLRALGVGWATRFGVALEARASRLEANGRDQTPPGNIPEAPLTIGVRATVLEAGVALRPARLRYRRLQPVARAAVARAHIVDSWESDTPAEEQRTVETGATVGGALELALLPSVVLGAGGSYRAFDTRADRHAFAFGLDGATWEVGLQWWPGGSR